MLSAQERLEFIDRIRRFPDELEALVKDLTPEQLLSHFIPGEWSVAQNVHHLADSHMNAFIRTKFLLTEDNPTVKGYNQDAWAARVDGFDPPIQASLAILRGLHLRWVALFESLSEAEWVRKGVHSESGPIDMEDILKTYFQHCNTHLEQITRTLAAGK